MSIYKTHRNQVLLVGIYVDDILMVGNSEHIKHEITSIMNDSTQESKLLLMTSLDVN